MLSLLHEHPDNYAITALPVVACIKQYLNGDIRRPGLWTQAEIVEPVSFKEYMNQMGLFIEESISV